MNCLHTTILIFLILAAFTAGAPARAEEQKETLQQQVAQQLNGMEKRHFITFNSENDLYGGGSDQNYTNGARVTYFEAGKRPHPIFDRIDDLIPTFTINPTTSIYYSLGHNLYTPKDITRVTQDPRDRPWAAFLYGSAGLVTITDNHIDEVEATLGVVGPAALGEQIQTFVHENISSSPSPRGWDNQLDNEPGVMLSWQRRWPGQVMFEGPLGLSARAEPHLGATVGNIHTYANTGLSLRLSPHATRFQDDPNRVRPSMPGTGAFIVPDDTFSWHLFGGVEGRAVARNIFLDGNTFSDSHGVDKVPLVMDASAGLALAYGPARVSYAVVYRSREFQLQDSGDIFGTVTLGFRY